MTLLTTLGHSTEPILAYIDPGLVTVAIQAFLILIFGAAATYITAPWRWFKSVFHRKQAVGDENAVDSEAEVEALPDDS